MRCQRQNRSVTPKPERKQTAIRQQTIAQRFISSLFLCERSMRENRGKDFFSFVGARANHFTLLLPPSPFLSFGFCHALWFFFFCFHFPCIFLVILYKLEPSNKEMYKTVNKEMYKTVKQMKIYWIWKKLQS